MPNHQHLRTTLNHPGAAASTRRNALFNSILKQLKIEWVWQYVEENNGGRMNTYHHNLHMKTIAVNCWTFFHIECPELANDSEHSLAKVVIAACLHDMNHSGGEFEDSVNIERAIAAVEAIEGSLDKQFYDGFGYGVAELIRVTQYPFIRSPYTQLEKILRDTDALQAYEPDGVTAIMEGLRMEMLGKMGRVPTHQEMYEGQIKFMKGVEYFTDTAKDMVVCFGEKLYDAFKAYAETVSGQTLQVAEVEEIGNA